MKCRETAADPTKRFAIVECRHPVTPHDGQHHAVASDGTTIRWGLRPARGFRPGPDPDWFDAYASGDEDEIAAARARYSTKLQDAGWPPLTDELDA